jgi:hypothetical protein
VPARWWLAVALLVGVTAGSGTAQPERLARVLEEGERRLAAGDAAGAEAAFDRAAGAAHDHDVEISLVRAYMQAGDYRRALAFAAHAAGAHGDAPATSALYAWLLTSGGQRQVAQRLLEPTLAAHGDDVLLAHAAARLAERWLVADAALLDAPARFAPYAFGAAAAGQVVASAMLSADGARALTPAASFQGDRLDVWVRNGLGDTVPAAVERRFEIDGVELAVLALYEPLPAPRDLAAAARVPFAGSVGYAVEFASQPIAEAAWPLLTLGFFGRVLREDELPPLGIDVPPGPRGGAAFDEAGRIVGLTVRAGDGSDRLAPVALLPEEVRPWFGAPASGATAPRSALDTIYERALLVTLQVIVAGRAER